MPWIKTSKPRERMALIECRNIKPLNKLVNKARDLRAGHKERHRPTGFGFALADSIDYLDANHWQAVTSGKSLFLTPDYLRVLETRGP